MSTGNLNQMITNKIKCLGLINHLISLEVIIEDRKENK